MASLRLSVLFLGTLLCLLTVTEANIRYLRTVAFSAQRTEPVTAPATGDKTIDSFRKVIRRDDNNFDSVQGVFTSPLKGVYAFAFNFHQDQTTSSSRVDTTLVKLVKESPDGTTVTDIVAIEGPPAPVSTPISVPSASVLLELDKGDKMYLATSDDVDAAKLLPISFSGYLLTRL